MAKSRYVQQDNVHTGRRHRLADEKHGSPVLEDLVALGGVVDEDGVEVVQQAGRRLEVLQVVRDGADVPGPTYRHS